MIKYLLVSLGSVAFALGILGIFIPLLPTTPFLLLASVCYLRSSEKLYNWLMHHRIFGRYIHNYLTYKAVSRSTKIGALLFLWLSLTLSILTVPHIHVRLFLVAIGIGVSIHLLRLKTLQKEEEVSSDNRQV